jgi:hypothetical protein
MAEEARSAAIEASAVPPTRPGGGYPDPFASRVAGECGGRSAIISASPISG